MEATLDDQVNFVYLDTSGLDSAELRGEYEIHSVPHYLLISEKGDVEGQWFGRLDEDVVLELVDNLTWQNFSQDS